MSIRKALGAVKDQTSISIAKVSSAVAPELDVAIVKATSHDDEPADEKHVREVLRLTACSRAYAAACVASVGRRLAKTRDYLVAAKCLALLHRLLAEGDAAFRHELLHASRRGARLLNLADFRDEAHSSSWDHSAFVRSYALYLDERLHLLVSLHPKSPPRRRYDGDYDGGNSATTSSARVATPVHSMDPERLLRRMHQLQQLLDRFLACRPSGAARHSRVVLVTLYSMVKESNQLYADLCEVLAVLLDRFFDMEYPECVKAFEAYASAAKQIDELVAFYDWCRDVGVARSSEYPEVQRINDKLLETLEEFMRERGRRGRSPPPPLPEPAREQKPAEDDMNSTKALPAPEERQPEPEKVEAVQVKKPTPPPQAPQGNLVDLREAVTADEQGNRLALALFSGPPVANVNGGTWEAFPSDKDPEVTSAWQTPAAEPGKADWELALVETASNLSKQKAALGGGLDPLLLNGMYDQGAVKQQVSAQAVSGSASSVALPGPGKNTTPVLALPAPDGTMQTIGGDPFVASLSVPPPSYVQMAEIERKQQLLVQEQQMWQQYQQNGMQGQSSLNKLNGNYGGASAPNPSMPYGMPMPYNAAGGYYHPTF